MKAKHLLMAMALPAVFAACQQDEFTAEGTNADALQGRKSIGQISFTTGDVANTRWTGGDFYNSITPELGDGLSVNLVDVPGSDMDKCFLNTQHDYSIDNYRVTEFRSTNYRFNRTADNKGWQNEGNLVEGNYVIVAPFVKGQGRNPIEAKLPVKQQLAFDKDGKLDPTSGIKEMLEKGDAPFMVSYKFLEANGNTDKGMPLEFQNMYSFPLVTVKNSNLTYAQGMVLKQIVIENPAGFILSAPLDHEGIRGAMINEVFAPKGTDKVDQALLGSWTAVGTGNAAGDLGNKTYWADYAGANKYGAAVPKHENKVANDYIMLKKYNETTSQFAQLAGGTDEMPWSRGLGMTNDLAPKTEDLLSANNRTMTNFIVVNMPDGGVAIPYNESKSFNVIMPAATYNNKAGEELKIYAIFDNVTWVKTLTSNTVITTLPGKQYPRQDYTDPATATPEVKGQKGGYFNVYTNSQNKDFGTYAETTTVIPTPNVAVVKTTEELIDAVNKAASDTEWTITVAGDDVVWNKAVNDKLAASRTQSINVQGRIKIAGDITIPNFVSFEDAVIEKGKVTFGGDKSSLGILVVSKGATLELKELANAPSNKAEIFNGGTLTLNADIQATVYNYKKLNINAVMTNTIIENNADKCNEAYGEILSKDVEFSPVVTILASGEYKLDGVTIDYPIIINEGKLTLANDVTLGAKMSTKHGDAVTGGAIANNKGTIADGKLIIKKEYNGKFTNTGTVDSNVEYEEVNSLTTLVVTGDKVNATLKLTADYTIAKAYTLGELTIDGDSKTLSGTATNAITATKVTISSVVNLKADATAAIIKPADLVLNATPTFDTAAGQIKLSTDNNVTGTAANTTTANIINLSGKTWTGTAWSV